VGAVAQFGDVVAQLCTAPVVTKWYHRVWLVMAQAQIQFAVWGYDRI